MKLMLIFAFIMANAYATTIPVEYVDLNKYTGTWYEIASIPQRFTRDCNCTVANYSLKKNGKMGVHNSCNRKSANGKFTDISGTAKVVDKKSNAKLKVRFFWPFSGDYWIIGLASDYRYAIISNSDGSSLWLLSRTPTLSAQDLKSAYEIIERNEIDLEKIQITNQNGCSYPNKQ